MQINPNEISYRKPVGKWKNSPVIEVGLKGGLCLIFTSKSGKFEALGSGSMPAIARHIAKKRSNDEIEYTELNKSEQIDPQHFQHVLPYWESFTNQLRSRQGLK